MIALTSLVAFRQYLGLADSDTADDDALMAALVAATDVVETAIQRNLTPIYGSRVQAMNATKPRDILLDADLLELTGVVTADGVSIPLSKITQLPDGTLRLAPDAPLPTVTNGDTAFVVSGWWGYHTDATDAWRTSDDTVLDNPLPASSNLVRVTDVDAGTPPRFQIGQLLRVDDELMIVTAIETTLNILTVVRGVNGTSATEHSLNTPIRIYAPSAAITQVVYQWAQWLYRTPDTVSVDIPPRLTAMLQGLRRVRV